MLPRSPPFSPWLFALALLIAAVNITPLSIEPITPAILIYALQDFTLPALLSPFLIPSWPAAAARALQLGWLASQPLSPRLTFAYFAHLYPLLLASRAGTGYIFGRSVGWKYPVIFSHAAVYEPIVGLGPLLLGSLLFDEVHSTGKNDIAIRSTIIFASSLLDGMPWGYMCGAAIVGVHRLLCTLLSKTKNTALPRYMEVGSLELAEGDTHDVPFRSKRRIVFTSFAAIICVCIAGNIPDLLIGLSPRPLPQPSKIHLIMLTVPRLRDITSDVMIASIQSYIDSWQATPGVEYSLTVFAHTGLDGQHVAFDRARAYFHTSTVASTGVSPITFFTQPLPSDEEPSMNHHAHLADALRYARVTEQEWTMFVEDDFVLCGTRGGMGLLSVLDRLMDSSRGKRYNGAFVGTGGSGIILHRSLLPTMESVLSMQASMNSSESTVIPPDVLMQQCLTGELQFCPEDGYVISSRMLMGHRGGHISTGDRSYEEGKWECGWRHPHHGRKGADVIVV